MTDLSNEFSPVLAVPLRVVMKIMNFIIITGGIVMALTFFFAVILRYGFNADLFAYEEWLMAVCFWMFFSAAAVATHDQSHINADILSFMISDKVWIWRKALLITTIELIIVVFITYWAFLMIQEEIADYPNWQKTIALGIPFFVPRFGIFIGFVMMTIYTILHLYLLIRNGPNVTELDSNDTNIQGVV